MINKLCIIACPFVAGEIRSALRLEGATEVEVVAFPSRCQGVQLEWEDIAEIISSRKDYSQIEIVGSHCLKSLNKSGIESTNHHIHYMEHCFSLFTGQEAIAAYLNEGGYLLTPGWLKGWRSRVSELGFSSRKNDSMAARSSFCWTRVASPAPGKKRSYMAALTAPELPRPYPPGMFISSQ